jgi:GNAT superfamily N-acetyltransferase
MTRMGDYLSDASLSRRLERAEGRACAAFVDAHAKSDSGCGAEWIEAGDALAMFDGADSPITQTFGLGLSDEPLAPVLDACEAFFERHGAPVFHETSPIALVAAMPQLVARGYQPIELTTLLFQPIGRRTGTGADENAGTAPLVRLIDAGEEDLWARTAAAGWGDVMPELTGWMLGLAEINRHRSDTACFLAEVDGTPVATGQISIHDGVAVLSGASTIAAWRGRGAQQALLDARLAYAATQRCDLAMFGASPGSASQRNAERRGFRIAYTRIKWRLRGRD